MAKTLDDIISELGLTDKKNDLTILINAMEDYCIITDQETRKINSISVKPLPNRPSLSAEEMKKKFVELVTNDSNGMEAVINKRIVLIYVFLKEFIAQYGTNKADIETNINKLFENLSQETARAIEKENELNIAISDETTRAQGMETFLNAGIEANKNSISLTNKNIEAIRDIIPPQATEKNQLADKEFVNYSIATSTATHRGTVDSLEKLKALTGDLNDYAYLEVTDSITGLIKRYDRYKYSKNSSTADTTGNWEYEYTLNNSSFTPEQWKAINDGLYSNDYGEIEDEEDNLDQLYKYDIIDNLLTQNSKKVLSANQGFKLKELIDLKADKEELMTKVNKEDGKGLSTNDFTNEEKENLAILKNYIGIVPSQANTSNQLADKHYVDSSIATNTATFRGTYTNISNFPSSNVDDNDYTFLDTTDELGNRKFDRYKYSETDGQWHYEYTLNNSSFTAEQWKSINSGISKEKLNEILTSLNNKVDKVTGKQLSTNDYTNEDKKQVEKIPSKATQIKAKLDTTDYLYDKLKIDLLNADSDIISTAEVELKKSELKYSTFIFNEDDDTCTMKGDCAGTTSMEERLECYPFNELYMEKVQLQDSSGGNLDGTDTFLVMPNLWYESKIHGDSKGWTITFANKKVNSNFKRMYESDEITELLLARYKAIKVGNYARSKSGDYPLVNTKQTTFDSYLPYYNGQKIDSNDYRNRILYSMLFVCFTGHRNSQNAYRGIVDYVWGNGTTSQYGESLKNGTTDVLGDGLVTGEITEFGGNALANGKRPFSVLGVENPYGAVWENVTGITHNASGELYAYEGFEHMTPSMMDPTDSNTYYTNTGITLSTANEGWQKTFAIHNGYPFPISVGGSSSANVGDYYWFSAGWRIFFVGGCFNNSSLAGLFSLNGDNGFGHSYLQFCFRLSLKR